MKNWTVTASYKGEFSANLAICGFIRMKTYRLKAIFPLSITRILKLSESSNIVIFTKVLSVQGLN